MADNSDRNLAIVELLKSERFSYSVIAEIMGTTRQVVAGVAFRHRHPWRTRVASPGSHGKGNKAGHGWQPASYYPEKTAGNTR